MLITDINVCLMAFRTGAIAFVLQGSMYVVLIRRMIDAACQDSIMAVSLF